MTYSGFVAIIGIIFIINGCVKQIQIPESEREVIKDFQRIVVNAATPPWTKTKINLNKGDQILIIASGSVTVWPGHLEYQEPYERLMMKIGNNGHPKLAVEMNNQTFIRSAGEGRLMFCVRDWDYLDSNGWPVWQNWCTSPDCYYRGNRGQYQVDAFAFADSSEDEIRRALNKITETNRDDKKLCSEIAFALQNISFSSKSYDEEVSKWTSYRDVQNWMAKFYTYDMIKVQKYEGKYIPGQPLPHPVKTPEESYEEKTGMCFDAAIFAMDSLNRIDPSYEAEVVHIENRPYFKPNHVVCSFKMDAKLYIIDYGVPKKTGRRGVFGPFNSLEEYKKFYIRQHPKVTRVKSISFGWPDYFRDRIRESNSRRTAKS
jgi:hypothetical protein